MQGFFTVNILSIYRCLLCNQDQFFYALVSQFLCFFDQTLHRYTAVISTDFRDNTVCTVFVTAFCNLQICIVTSGRHKSLCLRKRQRIDIGKFYF